VPSGLIRLIKQGFNAGMDHSGTSIGQPTNFFVGAALNLTAPIGQETRICTGRCWPAPTSSSRQPIYRPSDGRNLLASYARRYGKLEKPVLVGFCHW